MKRNKVIITAAATCLLFTSLFNINAYAEEPIAEDTSASVESPDTGDRDITVTVACAGISAFAILVFKNRKRKS